jgi:hypothetical protein
MTVDPDQNHNPAIWISLFRSLGVISNKNIENIIKNLPYFPFFCCYKESKAKRFKNSTIKTTFFNQQNFYFIYNYFLLFFTLFICFSQITNILKNC